MLKRVIGLLGIAWFVGPAAVAQQGIDPALIERGQLLYEINCVLCHKESGEGGVPMFPALDGNEPQKVVARPPKLVNVVV